MEIVFVFERQLVDQRHDHHGGLLLEHILHLPLLRGQLGLCGFVGLRVAVLAGFPLVLLFGLDLLLDELDHQRGQRVLVQVSQETVEDLALLVEQEVLKRGQLDLVEHLLHDLEL